MVSTETPKFVENFNFAISFVLTRRKISINYIFLARFIFIFLLKSNIPSSILEVMLISSSLRNLLKKSEYIRLELSNVSFYYLEEKLFYLFEIVLKLKKKYLFRKS